MFTVTMNQICFLFLFVLIIVVEIYCEFKENSKSKKSIPYFRKQVEEIEEKNISDSSENDEDIQSNLVSFLVDNVKEIFNDIVEVPETENPRSIFPTRSTTAATRTTEIENAVVKTTATQATVINPAALQDAVPITSFVPPVTRTTHEMSNISSLTVFQPTLTTSTVETDSITIINSTTEADRLPAISFTTEAIVSAVINDTNETHTVFTNSTAEAYDSIVNSVIEVSSISTINPTITMVDSTTKVDESTTSYPATDATEAYINTPRFISTHTDVAIIKNTNLPTLIDEKLTKTGASEIETKHKAVSRKVSDESEHSYNLKSIEKDLNIDGPESLPSNLTEFDLEHDPRKSCIMCNNVATEDCNDPKNKLIPSIMCDRDDDVCYSMHTPFGIVDRGCFNTNHNMSIYTCSCNLCNFISISDMPYTFDKKEDWINNVIELSRTRGFRKSIYRDMSCLSCEVNTTQEKGDVLENVSCLEGHIGNLPVEDCKQDEVCAVKALRADGYVWRGCVKAPLYNYWWVICDSDLCNYDTIVSLYDPI